MPSTLSDSAVFGAGLELTDMPRVASADNAAAPGVTRPVPLHFRRVSPPARASARRAPAWRAMAALCAAGLLAGCASTGIESQWVDPQLGKRSLAGTKVFVVCQAVDLTVRLVCGDQMAAQLKTLGAVPLLQQPTADGGSAPVTTPDSERANAHAAGAAVLFSTRIAPESVAVSSGPSFSFGVGGFGGSGRGGSGGGVGLGVAAPIGGAASPSTGYSASSSLTDVVSGRLMWSAKASAPPSSDVNQQLTSLAKVLLDSARDAGLFPR